MSRDAHSEALVVELPASADLCGGARRRGVGVKVERPQRSEDERP
jgi:hypothetical protein